MNQKSALAIEAPVHLKLFRKKVKKVDIAEARVRYGGHDGRHINNFH